MRERLRRFVAWMALVVIIAGTVVGLCLQTAFAGEPEAPVKANAITPTERAVLALAVALVTGAASWSAAFAVAKVGSAAMGAVSENPELMARSLIFVGLAEGIAIYGLIVAIMLLGKMG